MMHRFPKQGDREPWLNPQNYARDRKMLRHGPLEDGALVFSNPRPGAVGAAVRERPHAVAAERPAAQLPLP
jgi:hypothetical protein